MLTDTTGICCDDTIVLSVKFLTSSLQHVSLISANFPYIRCKMLFRVEYFQKPKLFRFSSFGKRERERESYLVLRRKFCNLFTASPKRTLFFSSYCHYIIFSNCRSCFGYVILWRYYLVVIITSYGKFSRLFMD